MSFRGLHVCHQPKFSEIPSIGLVQFCLYSDVTETPNLKTKAKTKTPTLKTETNTKALPQDQDQDQGQDIFAVNTNITSHSCGLSKVHVDIKTVSSIEASKHICLHNTFTTI